MPEVKEYTVFRFDELSDKAKERARDWYRELGLDECGMEHVVDDFATVCDALGIDVRQRSYRTMGGETRYQPDVCYSVAHCQGDFASFACRYAYKKGGLAALKAHAPQDKTLHAIGERLQEVQRKAFYKVEASSQHTHRNGMSVSVWIADECRDASDWEEEEVRDCMRDLAHWLYTQLREEVEYRYSEEYVDEAIRINEYTFDEDGRRED